MTRFIVEMQFDLADERMAAARPAHRAYWERQADKGILLGGGLFADGSGGMLLCEIPDEFALWRVIGGDPYLREGVVQQIRVREWKVVVGLSGTAPAEVSPEQLGLTMAGAQGSLIRRIEAGPRLVNNQFNVAGSSLTAHEQRIARLMVAGRTNREIAAQFQVSPRAVELHITSMYRKLGINRRAQLAAALAA